MTEELKPCPFCGRNEPEIIEYRPDLSTPVIWYKIKCTNSDCEATNGYFNTRKDAILAWNKRMCNE